MLNGKIYCVENFERLAKGYIKVESVLENLGRWKPALSMLKERTWNIGRYVTIGRKKYCVNLRVR